MGDSELQQVAHVLKEISKVTDSVRHNVALGVKKLGDQYHKDFVYARQYYRSNPYAFREANRELLRIKKIFEEAGLKPPTSYLADFTGSKSFDQKFFDTLRTYQLYLRQHKPSLYSKEIDGKWGSGTRKANNLLQQEVVSKYLEPKYLDQLVASKMSPTSYSVSGQYTKLFLSHPELGFDMGGAKVSFSVAMEILKREESVERRTQLAISLISQISEYMRAVHRDGQPEGFAANYFGHKYDVAATDPTKVLATGKFNCFSGSLAFASLSEYILQIAGVQHSVSLSNVGSTEIGHHVNTTGHTIGHVIISGPTSTHDLYFDMTNVAQGSLRLRKSNSNTLIGDGVIYHLTTDLQLDESTFAAARKGGISPLMAKIDKTGNVSYLSPEEIRKLSPSDALKAAMVTLKASRDPETQQQLVSIARDSMRTLYESDVYSMHIDFFGYARAKALSPPQQADYFRMGMLFSLLRTSTGSLVNEFSKMNTGEKEEFLSNIGTSLMQLRSSRLNSGSLLQEVAALSELLSLIDQIRPVAGSAAIARVERLTNGVLDSHFSAIGLIPSQMRDLSVPDQFGIYGDVSTAIYSKAGLLFTAFQTAASGKQAVLPDACRSWFLPGRYPFPGFRLAIN